MSDNKNSLIASKVESLCLFGDSVSDDENNDRLGNISENFESDDSDSHTSSASVNDIHLAQRRKVFVPPLELDSRDSSLLAANDPFMSHPNISLRNDSEDEVVTEFSDSDNNHSPSRRWNELNQKLQQVDRQRNTENNHTVNRAKETFLKANVDTQPLERVITVQDRPSGRFPSTTSDNRLPKIDHLRENKTIVLRRNKPPENSYRSLFEKRVSNGDSQLAQVQRNGMRPIGSNYTCETSVGTKNQSSDVPYIPSRNVERNEPQRSEKTQDNEQEDDALYKKPLKSLTAHRLRQRKTDLTRRRSHIEGIDPKNPNRNYYLHSVSSSGVYRLCAEQQANLEEASQKFRNSYAESCPAPLFTRLDIQCPPLRLPDRTISVCSTSPSYYPKSPFPDPFAVRSPVRRESIQMRMHRKRYTMHEFPHLPEVLNEARSLGPDFESDDFKARYAKVTRQRSYSDRVRELNRKSWTSNRNSRLEPTYEREEKSPDVISSTHLENNVQKENGEIRPKTDRQPEKDCLSNGSIESHDKPETGSDNQGTDKNDSRNSRDMTRVKAHIDPGTKLSSTELERKKAAEKRENMLSYADRVRTMMDDKRKRKQSGSDHQTQSPKNEDESTPAIFIDDLVEQTRMTELLKRHEEDRKVAESIQRGLKIAP